MRAPRWSVAAATIGAVVLVFGACSSDKAKEPRRPLDTTPAPGSVVVSDESIGFAVSLPNSWVKMPTDVGSFEAAAKQVLDQTPPTAVGAVAIGLGQLESAVRGGVAMAAIDPQTGEAATLVTVKNSGLSAEEIAVSTANQLIPTGATDLTREPLTVDGVEAVRQRFLTQVSGEAGAVVTLKKSQLYVVRRGEDFVLTVIGESPSLDGILTSLRLA